MRPLKVARLVLGAFLILTLPAGAAGRFRGGIVVGPAYGPWGWYSPFYGPYGWYGYGPFPAYYSNTAELKLKTNVKDADVYIDGAYAGKAEKLKSMWLRPDAYDVEIRAPGYAPFARRFYLMPGKTTKVKADLVLAPKA
jgi:PEGA domain